MITYKLLVVALIGSIFSVVFLDATSKFISQKIYAHMFTLDTLRHFWHLQTNCRWRV